MVFLQLKTKSVFSEHCFYIVKLIFKLIGLCFEIFHFKNPVNDGVTDVFDGKMFLIPVTCKIKRTSWRIFPQATPKFVIERL